MKVLELLCSKMEDPSPVVKYKALNVVKQVLQKGSAAFFREMGRKQAVIRECLNFRGPPDPLRGDAPYSQVRELAQQVINMVYDTQPSFNDAGFMPTLTPPPFAISTTQPPNSISSSPSSYSSNHYAAPSSNYRVSTTVAGEGKRVYVNSPKAIGSYVEYQPSTFETVMDAVSEGFETFKQSLSGNQQKTNVVRPPLQQHYGAGTATRTLAHETRYTTGDVSSLDYDGSEEGMARYENRTTISASSSAASNYDGLSRTTQAILDSMEFKAIVQLTPNTGRPNLPRTDISTFLSKVRNVPDARPLVECLLIRSLHSDSHWQSAFKALTLLEAILRENISGASLVVQPLLEALAHLSRNSVQSVVQEKVSNIIALYPPEERPTMKNSNSPSAQSLQPTADLLSQNDEEEGLFSGLQHSEPVYHHQEQKKTTSLIDDDFSSWTPSPTPQTNTHNAKVQDNGLDFLSAPSTTQDSLFEGLSVETNNGASIFSSSPAPTKPLTTQEPSLLDFEPSSSSTSNQEMLSAGATTSKPYSSGLDFFSPAPPQNAANLASNTQTNGVGSTMSNVDQLAILCGQRQALQDQLQLIRMQTMSPQRNDMESQIEARLKATTAQIENLERWSKSSTYSGASASLESVYRQQPSYTPSSIDYAALQTSHPVDPFDAIRHDIRR